MVLKIYFYKPGNFVSFREIIGTRFKAIDFDSSRRDGGAGASLRGPNCFSDEYTADG